MRTKNALLNTATTWIGQLSLIIGNLISRRIFIQVLGTEYLGISSLFSNILSFLSMAELGIGSAINYSLYKPIAENDKEEIKALMKLYKYVYYFVGLFVLVVGISFAPAIPHIAKGGENIEYLIVYYFMFVINTSISYFFSYKASYLIARQQKYVFNINHYLWQFVLLMAQIHILLKYNSYFGYLTLQVLSTIVENVIIAYIADKKYGYLKDKNVKKLSDQDKKEIQKNTAAMILNKIGSTLVNATDNILISYFINVSTVGIYGNYSVICSAVANLLYQGIFALTASIGNLSVSGSQERKREVFRVIYFIAEWLYGWLTISIYILLTPFVQLWYGIDYQLSNVILLVICINLYIVGQAVVTNVHISAFGLYWKQKYKGIMEGVINFGISVLLVPKMGLLGVIFGTLMSHIAYSFWIESRTVFKFGFNTSPKQYYLQFAKDSILVLIVAIITYKIAGFFIMSNLLAFLYKLVICVVVPNLLFVLIFHKRKEFNELKGILLNIYNIMRN